jgi:murein DD-endopeptidase MepM/ murein hydrolase activator NlpD
MKARTNRHQTGNSRTPAGRALHRAALVARKIARAHGTPIYVWRDGKVVAEKP